ncbi:alpha-1,3-galactosyltransferase 2-like [Rhinoraja longicauda]
MGTKCTSCLKYLVTKQKCFCLLLIFTVYSMLDPTFFRILEGLIPMEKCHLAKGFKLKPGNHADNYLDYWTRTDVQTCTDWNAPIIWDSTFNAETYDQMYKKQNVVIGLTVFAVGNYLDMFLEQFLVSADQHFMPGFAVIYYVFVDDMDKLGRISMKLSGRGTVFPVTVARQRRWQDNSMFRMKLIKEVIEARAKSEADYIFCFDVDQHFSGRFGTEALGESVALLHAWFYRRPKFLYTYETNPLSMAYLRSAGDFYYHAAVFGGTWQSVRKLTEACYQGIMEDKRHKVEALWHDESHLNKYFWLHKPTKILSPEYCWDPSIGWRTDIRIVRLQWGRKQYSASRQAV